ncbi:MAG: hypothetical protein WBC33_09425 [Conexibacter sp.]
MLRTKLQHAYDQVPGLERAGLIRVVGTAPTRAGKERTSLLAATQAGVQDWRAWLASPITMPDAMTGTLSRLYAVRAGDYATMIGIVDRYEALLQRMVQDAVDPGRPEDVVDRVRLHSNNRLLVAQLQWCQHARDEFLDAAGGERP